jgi:hypothetical protein
MAKSARNKKTITSEQLREKLKLKNLESKKSFKERHPKAHEFLTKRDIDLGKIREHSARIVGIGALTSSLLLTPPSNLKALPSPDEIVEKLKVDDATADEAKPKENKEELLSDILKNFLPERPRPLSRNEEKLLEQVFRELTGVSARATLEGEHLNTTYGKIGAEQHLKRYPGDSLANHAPAPDQYKGDDPQEILKEGIAPGLGAWGYFAPSQAEFTPDLEETERWYGVVQTLYLPDWNTRTRYLRDWYKHRKIMIVNVDNGKAVVAAVADSGPAMWTGKNFGGSPEVMDYLGGPRYKKGPVIVFFVDDPENKMPLGPVEYNK